MNLRPKLCGSAVISTVLDAHPASVTIYGVVGCGYSGYAGPLLATGASVRWVSDDAPHPPAPGEVVLVMRMSRGGVGNSQALRGMDLGVDAVADLLIGEAFVLV